MAVILHLHVSRKPGLSFNDFREHHENTHIPLMKTMSGALFPLSHIRRYIVRSPDKEAPIHLVSGSPEAFSYDAIAELTYKDVQHFQAHSAWLQDVETRGVVGEDCAEFMDVAGAGMCCGIVDNSHMYMVW